VPKDGGYDDTASSGPNKEGYPGVLVRIGYGGRSWLHSCWEAVMFVFACVAQQAASRHTVECFAEHGGVTVFLVHSEVSNRRLELHEKRIPHEDKTTRSGVCDLRKRPLVA